MLVQQRYTIEKHDSSDWREMDWELIGHPLNTTNRSLSLEFLDKQEASIPNCNISSRQSYLSMKVSDV